MAGPAPALGIDVAAALDALETGNLGSLPFVQAVRSLVEDVLQSGVS